MNHAKGQACHVKDGLSYPSWFIIAIGIEIRTESDHRFQPPFDLMAIVD